MLDLAGVGPGIRVLDVGCGNGAYLHAMHSRGIDAVVGCDLSRGMLRAALPFPALVNGDVEALPLDDAAFDVVLAPHMLYHVPNREAAARELRRVLQPDGVCIAITNGARHLHALLALVEEAARDSTPGWRMETPSTVAFSLENGGAQLSAAFASVAVVRPEAVPPVVVRDAQVVTDYVASLADHYANGVGAPWPAVVEHVRRAVQREIDDRGGFVVSGDTGAFVCR